MSNADFQDRLKNISANTPQQQPIARGVSHTGRRREAQKPSYGRIGAGGAIMLLGHQAVKYANENYEAIRDSSGIVVAAVLGLAGMAALLIGVLIIIHAIFKRRANPERATESVRQASIGARVFFSLLGFTFGSIASLCMFMAAAARFVETETAELIGISDLLIPFLLIFVSLLFGLVGLFLRGYALGRVPVYFLFGGVLTFATVRFFGINMLEWPRFLALLQ